MMGKQMWGALALVVLGGCAASSTGPGLNEVETDRYLRDERSVGLDFVKIQRAVFKHTELCGGEVRFQVDDLHPGYARVTAPIRPGAKNWAETMIIGVMRMEDASARSKFYSYYTPTRAQIDGLYNAFLKPEQCGG